MYYPKDKILENLDALQGEFVYKKTLKPYIGKYISTYDNKYFVGADYTGKNEELIKAQDSPTNFIKDASDYRNLTNVKITGNDKTPYYNPIFPTEEDYNNGTFFRYFSNRVNSSPKDIIEIDLNQYSDVSKNILYLTTKIDWRISKFSIQDVIIFNTDSIRRGESEIPGLKHYLKNPIEYYKKIL